MTTMSIGDVVKIFIKDNCYLLASDVTIRTRYQLLNTGLCSYDGNTIGGVIRNLDISQKRRKLIFENEIEYEDLTFDEKALADHLSFGFQTAPNVVFGVVGFFNKRDRYVVVFQDLFPSEKKDGTYRVLGSSIKVKNLAISSVVTYDKVKLEGGK